MTRQSIHILFFFALAALAGAQTPAVQDTVKQRGTVNKSGLEGPIQYEARLFDNFVAERRSVLEGQAQVRYLSMTLKAARITVDWSNDLMTAQGLPDTVWTVASATGDSARSVVMTGLPEFIEGGDVMHGEEMVYNFRTQKGRVTRGRTSMEDGHYGGQVMKLMGKKTAFISNARFTTCDDEENPHFHFWCQKMRMDVGKDVVAKPIVMYIGHIPVMALPFAYFPIEKGRRSGLVLPRYGESSTEGRYLKGLGYYWAASDYWDVEGTVDYYEKSGFLFRGDLNYNVRYLLQGNLSGSFTRKDFAASGTKARRWDLSVQHSQTISPTMRLSVNGTFVSSKDFYKDLSANREQRLQQQIRSNATLTKTFGGSRSITVNLSQTRDLETDAVTEILPRISFRGGQTPLFKAPESDPRSGPAPSRWYHSIYLSYSSQLESRRSKLFNSSDSSFNRDTAAGWDHTVQLSSPQKLFGWLTVNPNMGLQETWLTEQVRHYWDSDSSRVIEQADPGFAARHTFNLSVAMSTKIYGLFRPRFMPNVMMRHVVTPSVSYGYQPDFSDERWAYYDAVADTAGELTYYDRFESRLFSSTPQGGRQSLSFSVNNLFQMKMGQGEQEKKFDLFNWNVSTNYNWEKPEKKLANFSSTLRANPRKDLSINLRAVHSPYRLDEEGKELDETYAGAIDWSSLRSVLSNRYLRLVYFSADLSLRLKGTAKGGGRGMGAVRDSSEQEGPAVPSRMQALDNVPGDRLNLDDGTGSFNIPWDLTASLSYSDSRYTPTSPVKKFWGKASLNFNLTKNWRIAYQTHYDFMEKEIVSQDFVFQRDLHCWEARIAWTPTGPYKRFYFRINIKSSMLKDIKLEKRTGRQGYY